MHVAVEKGAKVGADFKFYVEWLIQERYAPRGAEAWLTYVKDRGNEANHELVPMTNQDATGVLRFTEALLRGVYELPNIVPRIPEKKLRISYHFPKGTYLIAGCEGQVGSFDEATRTMTLKRVSLWRRLRAWPKVFWRYYQSLREVNGRLVSFHVADTFAFDVFRPLKGMVFSDGTTIGLSS